MGFRDFSQFREGRRPGVCEEHVQATLPLLDRGVQTIQVGQVRNVPLNAKRVRADQLHRRTKFSLPPTRDEHVRAFRDETLRRCQTDSAVAARDERDLAFEFSGHKGLR